MRRHWFEPNGEGRREATRLLQELDAAVASLQVLLTRSAEISESLGQVPPNSLDQTVALIFAMAALAGAPTTAKDYVASLFDRAENRRLPEALAAGKDWTLAHRAAEPAFADSTRSALIAAQRSAIARGQASFFARLFGPYRRANGELAGHLKGALPKTAAERLALIDRLAEVQRSRRLLADEEAWLQSALGYAWRGERTAFAEVLDAALWLGKIRSAGVFAKAADLPRAMAAVIDPATTALGLNDRLHEAETRMTAPLKLLGFDPAQIGLGAVRQANMADMQRGLMRMRDEILRHSEWTQLKRAMLALTNAGAECIVQAVSAELLEPARASAEFAYACAEARWTAARKSRPKLDDIAAHDRHAIVDRFRGLERDRLKDAQTLILAKHYAQVPKGHAGEMAVIRGEIARKKGHKPIRWVNCCMQLVRLGQGGLIFGRNARVADQRHQNHPSAI